MILEELFDEQQEALLPYIETKQLKVDVFSAEDLLEIWMIRAAKPNLSEQDCSALYHAQKTGAALITSDNLLRKFAHSINIEVHGHLWIFDHMVNADILSGETAAKKLMELCNVVNPRLGLPKQECQRRFRLWGDKSNDYM
ncbi:MAG TPA: hypothetical protein DEP28_10070 [Bacteroidetes bacterium]|nr:hypothetical protein [Bacteroidota bacterium]